MSEFDKRKAALELALKVIDKNKTLDYAGVTRFIYQFMTESDTVVDSKAEGTNVVPMIKPKNN